MRKRIAPVLCSCVVLVWFLAACQQTTVVRVAVSPAPSASFTATHSVTPSTLPTPALSVSPTPTQLVHPALPRPAHVVIVMEENHSYADIIGSAHAPYINALSSAGATFRKSFAITHPSEPNYLALFSGSTYGLTSDACPEIFTDANLGSELSARDFSFTGYSEGLPGVGATTCSSGSYARKHSPWVNFPSIPTSAKQPFTSFPGSSNYSSLPTVSFVIPDLNNDMHDGTIQEGDTWLRQNLSAYVIWAQKHNSLLIVTWDEDDGSESNQIPTLFVGPMVRPGQYSEIVNHYRVLRTLEDMYGLAPLANSSAVAAIADCWS